MKNLFLLVIGIMLISLLLSAIPKTLNYQGKMTDTDGVGLNGNFPMTFTLYSSESGGEPLWTENRIVPINKGLLSVTLGEITPFPDEADFTVPYWLEITFNCETLSPREKLNAVPYSFYADKAENVVNAIQSVSSDSSSVKRTGNFVFRAGEGATLSDDGSNIYITLGTVGGGTTGSIPSIYDVLIAGDDAGGREMHNLANPTAPQDVATKSYVDNSSVSSIIGGEGLSPDGPSMGDFTLDVNVDDATIEIDTDILRVKASGITSSHIANATIQSEDIGAREVQSSNIEIDAVLSEHIIANAIQADEIADNSVGYNHLEDFTVTTPSMGDIFYYDGSQWVNLPKGDAGQVLAMNPSGTIPYWETPDARAVYNFYLDVEPSADGVQAGLNVSTGITAESIIGTPQEIEFRVSGLSSGVTANFTPSAFCTPSGGPPSSCTRTLELVTTSGATRGTYPITITGTTTGGSVNSTSYLLTIATTPGAVGDLTDEFESGNVVLNWTAPSDNGGSLITNYIIYRGTSPNPTDSIDAVGSVLTYTDTDVSGCTMYYYRITAVNAIGEGNYSNEISFMSSDCPNCLAIKNGIPGSSDGEYTIDPDGIGGLSPFDVYCDMTTDDGGWTLAFTMGYSGGGDIRSMKKPGESGWTPFTTSTPDVSTLGYSTLEYTQLRFAGNIEPSVKRIFNKSAVPTNVLIALLNGIGTSGALAQNTYNDVVDITNTHYCLAHNNGGSEAFDIISIGTVPNTSPWGHLVWGNTDSKDNWGGVRSSANPSTSSSDTFSHSSIIWVWIR